MSEETYVVRFRASGYTAPSENNPNGIRVSAEGSINVKGKRPDSNFKIPFEAIAECKKRFMEETGVVRFSGDRDGWECFPTVWLGAKRKLRASAVNLKSEI